MNGPRGPTALAFAAASLIGAIVGSISAAGVDSLGLTPEGTAPLLAGEAAIYVASALGAFVGAAAAQIAVGLQASRGPARGGVLLAALVSLLGGVLAGLLSDTVASGWIHTFSADPLEAAVVGAALASVLAGSSAAAAARYVFPSDSERARRRWFGILLGGVAGTALGVGGASVGATLAQSTLACPNGYYVNPSPVSGCVPGLLQGTVLFGLWAGAATGAAGALLFGYLFHRLAKRTPVATSTAV